MGEFGIPKKLVALTYVYVEDTLYQIRVEHTMYKAFEVSADLK